MEQKLSRPTCQERIDSFCSCFRAATTLAANVWARGANRDPDVGNSACCFTLKFPTWANGQDPGWPSMEMTSKDRVEARNMQTAPITRVTLIGIKYAEAMRKQNAKAATQGTYQPDCIPLGGNTGRARVADALGHAKEIPHTKQTSSYVYDERLARALDGRIFENARYTTTICNPYARDQERRTVPKMLGHPHDQRLCIPDDPEDVFDATLALGNADDTKSMGHRLSKHQTWLQTQHRTEKRLNWRKKSEEPEVSDSHSLYTSAPKAMRSGMLRTQPIDEPPTWTIRSKSTSPVSATPPRLNWLTPAAKRSVLQMTNWDGANDQEWKRRKALDAKARRQDPSIPPPGMKVTAVQRLVRAEAARDRYVNERPYLAAHNDNGNDEDKDKNMLLSMPVDREMSLKGAITDFVTYEQSIAEQTVQPEIKKHEHIKNQFTLDHQSSCGAITRDSYPHVAIENLPAFLAGKNGWLMKNGATAWDRQNNGIVKYPLHLSKKSRKTVLTQERFEMFKDEFEEKLNKLEAAYSKRMEALEALRACATNGELDFPEGFNPWKDQFEPPEHVAAMPIWQEFEHWANERYGSLAQRHSHNRKLAAEHDWQSRVCTTRGRRAAQ